MVRVLSLSERMAPANAAKAAPQPASHPSGCEHRTVSKDGRIVCQKIVEGQAEVSATTCRACPFKAVDCAHLRFSLRHSSPSPLVVRYNGRVEHWDDGPAGLRFDRAACAARVAPLHDPRACADCALRQSLRGEGNVAVGKVVAFPDREALAAAG